MTCAAIRRSCKPHLRGFGTGKCRLGGFIVRRVSEQETIQCRMQRYGLIVITWCRRYARRRVTVISAFLSRQLSSVVGIALN